jgi:hypothetical protein
VRISIYFIILLSALFYFCGCSSGPDRAGVLKEEVSWEKAFNSLDETNQITQRCCEKIRMYEKNGIRLTRFE